MKLFCHRLFIWFGTKQSARFFFAIFFPLALSSCQYFFKKHLFQILAIAVVVISISGCKGTHEIVREVPVYVHDTTQIQSVQKDSIYIHDSVNVYSAGDTVFVTKSVTKSVTKIERDTIRVVSESPVEVTVEKPVYIEKHQKWYDKMLIFFGELVVVALVGFLISFLMNRRK